MRVSKAGLQRGSLGVEYNGGCLSVSLEGSVTAELVRRRLPSGCAILKLAVSFPGSKLFGRSE